VTTGAAPHALPQVTRVLVVDDAVVVRQIVARALESEAGLELAGVASNGLVAMNQLARLQPDIIILDLEMPEMDGFQTLAAIRRLHPKLPVIVYSHLSAHGASATLEALTLGATDFALKPRADGIGLAVEQVRSELVPLIKALAPQSSSAVPCASARNTERLGRVSAIVVAASTGGPNALAMVLNEIPAEFRVPILIVQHMPAVFTATLAERLDVRCRLPVVEAVPGETVTAGKVYIAPGGHHLEVVRRADKVSTVLQDGPKENSCRPSADVLFRTAADVYGAETLAVVLTGMGHDGLRGAKAVRARGGSVIVESETTAVVTAMPAAVAAAGLAYMVLPIDKVGSELERRVSSGRST
jgi:two-component system, chemotaxis family, protein-glutamate methylesterase/glutaminase